MALVRRRALWLPFVTLAVIFPVPFPTRHVAGEARKAFLEAQGEEIVLGHPVRTGPGPPPPRGRSPIPPTVTASGCPPGAERPHPAPEPNRPTEVSKTVPP